MDKATSKRKQRTKQKPLAINGRLTLPAEVLPWERELLAVIVKAVQNAHQEDSHPGTGHTNG
jgi:hypothetical protein